MFSTILESLGLMADLAGGALLLVALVLYKRHHAPIEVFLTDGDTTIHVPLCLTRDQLSRAELMGRLGTIAKVPRFTIEYFKDPRFFSDLASVLAGKYNSMYITCTAEELKQF